MNTPGFQGFTQDGLAFLRTLLTLQQNLEFDAAREYYAKNKPLYEREIKAPMGLLVENLCAAFKDDKIPLKGDRHSSLFRINRDIRFSPDKSPYKTHAGAVLTPSGTKNDQGLIYIHIDPTGCFMAAGFHIPQPPELARIRRDIRDRPKAFKAMLAKLTALGLHFDQENTLKRLPRGFEDVTDPELAQAVKLKSFTVSRDLRTEDVMNAGLVEKLRAFTHEVMPLLEFGWEAIRRED
ncbi:TIGR02453 family protein [Fundidesulfovibrio terrae]|uniref:TIGR02453 family protein n=1 Tax=Fundidesulfovibrio terrae TaxID=2922866 RepID=UPI001FAEE704|nr:TIGR02453 family protein [Fundidesulfovibrio terrae]